MKILRVETELFYGDDRHTDERTDGRLIELQTDRQKDRPGEINIRFLQFWECAFLE